MQIYFEDKQLKTKTLKTNKITGLSRQVAFIDKLWAILEFRANKIQHTVSSPTFQTYGLYIYKRSLIQV